jgi:hypothetical protein
MIWALSVCSYARSRIMSTSNPSSSSSRAFSRSCCSEVLGLGGAVSDQCNGIGFGLSIGRGRDLGL